MNVSQSYVSLKMFNKTSNNVINKAINIIVFVEVEWFNCKLLCTIFKKNKIIISIVDLMFDYTSLLNTEWLVFNINK